MCRLSLDSGARGKLVRVGYGAGVSGPGKGPEKGLGGLGSVNFAGEGGAKRAVAPVNGAGGVLILFNDGAVQCDTGEYALGARVGEDLGIHLPVSAGRGVAA